MKGKLTLERKAEVIKKDEEGVYSDLLRILHGEQSLALLFAFSVGYSK